MLIALLSFKSYTQYDLLLHKPYKEKYYALDSLLETAKRCTTYSEALTTSKKIQQLGRQHSDPEMVLEGKYYLAFYILASEKYNEEQAITRIEDIAEEAKEKNILSLQIRANYILGYYCWNVRKNYEKGFRYYLKTERLMQQTTSSEFPNFLKYYNVISSTYYLFRDYQTAIKLLNKAIQQSFDRYNWRDKWTSYNNMGLYYDKLGLKDSAMQYFQKALEIPLLEKQDIRYTIANGNIGSLYYSQEKYDQAAPLIRQNYENAVKNEDWGIAAGAAILLADIYIKHNESPQAEQLLHLARSFISRAKKDHLLESYFQTTSKFYSTYRQQSKLGAIYQDSLIIAIQQNHREFDAMILLRVQQKYDLNQLEAERQSARLYRKMAKMRTITILAVSILTIGILSAFFFLKRKSFNMEQKQKQKEIDLTERRLKLAEQQLNTLRNRIEEKRKNIEVLKSIESDETAERIRNLRNKAIITEKDWKDFCNIFDTVYPEYRYHLKLEVPGISPAEVRSVLLYKLGLETEQVADALGVSKSTIRTTWYRLKNKLSNSSIKNIQELADSIRPKISA